MCNKEYVLFIEMCGPSKSICPLVLHLPMRVPCCEREQCCSPKEQGAESSKKKKEQQFHLCLLVLRSFYCSHAKIKIASSSTEHSSICLLQADSASVQIIVNTHLLGWKNN